MSVDDQKPCRLRRTLALVLLSACMTACSKTVSWTEEVQLSNGQVLIVERSTHFRPGGGEIAWSSGWKPEQYTIRFRYPLQSNKEIVWRSTKISPATYPELPLVLDIERDTGAPFVITNHHTSETCDHYVWYRYVNGRWSDISIPEKIQTYEANLYLGAAASEVPKIVTIKIRRQNNSDIRYRRRYRQIGPDRTYCGF